MSATADVLVVGSGAAGLTAALNLAEDHKVAVIAKGALGEGATGWAQGGIAAVLEEGDSFEAHVNDTMIAGAGLNDRRVVEHVVEAAPRAIQHLIDLGVPFATDGAAPARNAVVSPAWRLVRAASADEVLDAGENVSAVAGILRIRLGQIDDRSDRSGERGRVAPGVFRDRIVLTEEGRALVQERGHLGELDALDDPVAPEGRHGHVDVAGHV